MASWVEIYQEMVAAGAERGLPMDLDGVRRSKIAAVESITGRRLAVYAVDTANPGKTAGNSVAGLINFNDKDGFLEALNGIDPAYGLDVLVHSPGGLAEATESIVVLLRSRFPY